MEDVPRAARFYRDVLELAPASEVDEEWAWFWAGEPGTGQRLAVHRGTLLFEEHSPHRPGERWEPRRAVVAGPGLRRGAGGGPRLPCGPWTRRLR